MDAPSAGGCAFSPFDEYAFFAMQITCLITGEVMSVLAPGVQALSSERKQQRGTRASLTADPGMV